MAAAAAAAANTGPVPFKDVDEDGTAARAPSPKEEFGDLVAALLRKEQYLDGRLYQGFWLPEHYAPGIITFQLRFKPRPGDVVLVSYPKCGTTWLKALAFAAMTRAAYQAGDHPLLRLNPHDCIPFFEETFTDGHEAMLDRLPSPRLINTHIPYPLLPEAVTCGGDGAGCKVVYICRDPKDMVVSLYHFIRRLQPDLSFTDMFDSVADGTVPFGPMWDHILSYWHESFARPDRVLFLKYEDVLQDAGEHVRALARFMILQPIAQGFAQVESLDFTET